MNHMEMDTELRHQLMLIFTFFVFVTGSCIGSFLNVVIWRLPRGESLSHPASHCPACNHPLAIWQNVPLFGWLVLRGRCFYCKVKISARYPVVELITALLFTAVWLSIVQAGLPWGGVFRYLFLAGALLAVAVIDAEHRIIPDKITYTGIGVALLCSAIYPASTMFPGYMGGADATAMAVLPIPEAWTSHGTIAGAVLASILGMCAGAAFPALARCGGSLLWGQRELPLPNEKNPAFSATPKGVRFGGGPLTDIGGLIGPDHERCELRVTTGIVRWHVDGKEKTCELRNDTLALDPEFVEFKGRILPLCEFVSAEGAVSRVQATREVLGLGDVKLMAMCGAFLGISATVSILLVASAVALAAGIPAAISRKRFSTMLPFGPFIALAALAVFFFGDRLVLWYGHVILGALSFP